MITHYEGPLRDEPLAIELHNTRYAQQGRPFDGLVDTASMRAWLAALGDRIPTGGAGRGPTLGELTALRRVVREVLHAATEDRSPSRSTIAALNRASERVPWSAAAHWRREGPPQPTRHVHATRRADVVLGAIAADTIDLLSDAKRSRLHLCGAPGCVLMYLKDHPRREWCSAACGNRARQARHYARAHAP